MLPPSVSLLTTVPETFDPDLHWANGFCWLPEGSGNENTGVMEGVCTDGEVTKDTSYECGTECFCSFIVWAADRSSTFAFEARDWMGRVTRKLEAAQAKLIEHEIYTNSLGICTQAIALSGGNPNFVDATPAGGPLSPRSALAALEDIVADVSVGQQAVFHVRPFEIVPWMETCSVTKEPGLRGGQRFVSPMGNLIVPGRGYTGQGPGGQPATPDVVWAYATPVPQIRLGPVLTIPNIPDDPEDEGAWSAVTDALRNHTVVYAEREVVVAWEQYMHVGIQIDRSLY